MRIMTVVGARPQFVKAAALSRALAAQPDVTEVLVHTGQHYDKLMSDSFFAELKIPAPGHHLGVGSGKHGAQTGAIMAGLEQVIEGDRPDVIVVFGDTNSTLAAALVGAKSHVPVAHVEAGLRSFDRRMPEEVNRIVTDHVSQLLLCPSQIAVDLLAAEGITDGVHLVGDLMYDVFLDSVARLGSDDDCAGAIGVTPGQFALVTVHRANNTDDPARFAGIVDGLRRLADQGLDIVWPAHPRTRALVEHIDAATNMHIIEPATYRQMLTLLRGARVVLTDSGGLQKEALWTGRPCVTLRDETEWTETVDCGWNTLAGTSSDAIVAAALAAPPAGSPPPIYGDGHAAEATTALLLEVPSR